jgi:RNA polymerase sigma-70 factor, ECF subfamily
MTPLSEPIHVEDIQHCISSWVQDHGDYLFRHAYVRVGNREIAEDLVQDTFLAALENIQAFQNRSSIRTWLFSILKNKVIDSMRRATREVPLATELDYHEGKDFFKIGLWSGFKARWAESPETILEQNRFSRAILRCISKMPARFRTIFLLKALDGVSTEELCNDLDITPSNLWVVVYRSRMQLRDCLDTTWFRAGRGR